MRISLSFNRAFLSIESILVVFLSDGSFWCSGEGVVKVRFWAVRMVEYQCFICMAAIKTSGITAMVYTMDININNFWFYV